MTAPPHPALLHGERTVTPFGSIASNLNWTSAVLVIRIAFGIARSLCVWADYHQTLHELGHLSDDDLGDVNCGKLRNLWARFVRRMPPETHNARIDDSSAESAAPVLTFRYSVCDE